MLKILFIILTASSCANISKIDVSDKVCVGRKVNQYVCYYGEEVVESECLEYGYGQNKGSVEFSYYKDVNCWEFCNYAYDKGFDCEAVNLSE